PRTTHRARSANFTPLPCINSPTRKIRPAAHTHANVVASTSTTPTAGCHHATPGGIATPATIIIRVANGKDDIAVATGPSGSGTTAPTSITGSATSRITGINSACVSWMSPAAAPTAMNSDAYINTASTRYAANHANSPGDSASVSP